MLLNYGWFKLPAVDFTTRNSMKPKMHHITIPETNMKSLKNGWLGYYILSFWGNLGLFSGAICLCSFFFKRCIFLLTRDSFRSHGRFPVPPNRFLRLLEASSSRRAYAQPGEPASRHLCWWAWKRWWLVVNIAYLFMFYLWLYFIFAVQRDLSEGVFCSFKGGILWRNPAVNTRLAQKKVRCNCKQTVQSDCKHGSHEFLFRKTISDGYVWHFDCMACDRGKPIWTNIFERRIRSSKIQDFVDFWRHFEVGNAFFFEACSGFLWTLHIVWVFGEGKFSTSEHRFSIYTTV